jgi:hypothetical protein
VTERLELIGDEAVAETRVVAMSVDGIVDQVGVGEVPIADRFGPPFEIGLLGEAEHPTGQRVGDALVSQVRNQRVDL